MKERLIFNDIQRLGLEDQVKEVFHKEFRPIFTNDSTYNLEFKFDFLLSFNYKYEFNNNGYLTHKTEYRKERDSLAVRVMWHYNYDSINRIKQEKRISLEFSRDTSVLDYEYIGDSITNIKRFDKTFKLQYFTYIQKGDLEILHYYNSDSSFVTKQLFAYDKYNRIIRSEDYKNKEFIQHLTTKIYSDTINRKEFKKITIWAKYNNSYYSAHEYDKNYNSIKKTTGRFDTNKTSVSRCEYDYDNRGNWVEKRLFDWGDGKLKTVYKRDVIYYNEK